MDKDLIVCLLLMGLIIWCIVTYSRKVIRIILIAVATLSVFAGYLFICPDSPVSAWFTTTILSKIEVDSHDYFKEDSVILDYTFDTDSNIVINGISSFLLDRCFAIVKCNTNTITSLKCKDAVMQFRVTKNVISLKIYKKDSQGLMSNCIFPENCVRGDLC